MIIGQSPDGSHHTASWEQTDRYDPAWNIVEIAGGRYDRSNVKFEGRVIHYARPKSFEVDGVPTTDADAATLAVMAGARLKIDAPEPCTARMEDATYWIMKVVPVAKG